MAAALAMSVFGSLQIVSLVSARIPYAMARDGVFFAALARLSPPTRVPIRALVGQAAWAIVLVFSGSYDTLTDYAIFADSDFRRPRDRVGLRLPAPACRTAARLSHVGLSGRARSCSCSSRPGSWSAR